MLIVSASYDGGATYTELSDIRHWEETTELTLSEFSAPASLKFRVRDTGYRGGFLATVGMECDDGYSQTWITDDGFSIEFIEFIC